MSVTILPQPDDESCGPTSLQAVYLHHGLALEISTLKTEIESLDEGGTLAVYLGLDALKRGFQATIYSSNFKLFDPSWSVLSGKEIAIKLEEQAQQKPGKKLHEACEAYGKFLRNGGSICLDPITPILIKDLLSQKKPLIAGLSATYLYQCKREYYTRSGKSIYSDTKGFPTGHFVVLAGMENTEKVSVADPYHGNPIAKSNYYHVEIQHLINAIHLGIVTFDANILQITK